MLAKTNLTLYYLFTERSDIMATKSFTDTYKIKRSDVNNFRNIMTDTRKLKIRKVKGHQDIRDKNELKKFFGLSK